MIQNTHAWIYQPVASLSDFARAQALEHQAQLTKPPGSLGILEELAVRLCAMQGSSKPVVDPVKVCLFAADHGVAELGVSAFPQAVTREMLANFVNGGACLSVLSGERQTALEVIDVGVLHKPGQAVLPGVIDARIASGSANPLKQDAMTKAQLDQALRVGYMAAERAHEDACRLFIGGEMGIGNTTVASILLCLAGQVAPGDVTGNGTGVFDQAKAHKQQVIEKVVERYRHMRDEPLAMLRSAGGFEIAALVGAYLRCAQLGIAILVDGFITAVAAFLAVKIQPVSQHWMFFGHCSREPGNQMVLSMLGERPLLRLDMALGEASGAMMALPILRSACAIHQKMATFQQAAISNTKA